MQHPTAVQFIRMAVASLAVAVVLACGTAGCSSAAPVVVRDGIAEQAVRFPGHDLMLEGRLFAPVESADRPSRRAAIVLLHGCGGMVDARGTLAPRHRDWAERFARWGFVALTLDSFGPRGIGSLCELKDRPVSPWNERTADAHAALEYLAARADVEAQSVFVLGWSHGGSTVLGVIRRGAPGSRRDGPRFKAAIAFYPGCALPLRRADYEATLPTLILHGQADDWTLAAPCVALAERARTWRYPMQTILYADAHHGFDQPGGALRYLPNVYNPAAPGERSAHVGPHHPSRLQAIDEVERFLRRNR